MQKAKQLARTHLEMNKNSTTKVWIVTNEIYDTRHNLCKTMIMMGKNAYFEGFFIRNVTFSTNYALCLKFHLLQSAILVLFLKMCLC